MIRLALLLVISLAVSALVWAQQTAEETDQSQQAVQVTQERELDAPAPDGIRPGGTIAQEFEPPPIPPEVRSMPRPVRNYPEQPPVIPHNIRDYQVDKNFNRCLSCHNRSATETSGAVMVSVTHYRDRDGQVLAAVSPRRYFCLQCHVPQHQVEPIKGNNFKGIDEVLQEVIIERESQKETWRTRLAD